MNLDWVRELVSGHDGKRRSQDTTLGVISCVMKESSHPTPTPTPRTQHRNGLARGAEENKRKK